MTFIRLADPKHEAVARALLRLRPAPPPPGITGDCWIWDGGVDGKGYAKIRTRQPRSEVKVHRIVYEVLVGAIPEGLTLDHLCRVRRCANPAHLEPVTLKENILRGGSSFATKARQTHCKRNHPLSGDNLRITKRGTRTCRACERERDRRRKRSKGATE